MAMAVVAREYIFLLFFIISPLSGPDLDLIMVIVYSRENGFTMTV